jgi:hypothetical protein
VIYALGATLSKEKSFKLTQNRPTSQKHLLVDTLMRGMKKQAEEMAHLPNASIKAVKEGDKESLEFRP